MSSYENKKKLLFDCLTSAEQCIKGTSLEQSRSDRNELAQRDFPRNISKRFHGKESIFKRPEAPIGKCLRPRRLPDYQANPHKWKKYSLDDADISDRTNTSAAFAFLAEMEKRKDSEEMTSTNIDAMDTNDGPSGRILFKKLSDTKEIRKPSFNKSVSLRKRIEQSDDGDTLTEKPILKGSKVVMPEYVVGQKVSKKVKRISSTSTDASEKKRDKSRTPHLDHLFEEDDKIDLDED